MENGAEFVCPYCATAQWLAVDFGGGSMQRFISDCEVCCRPIQLTVRIGVDGFPGIEATSEEDPY